MNPTMNTIDIVVTDIAAATAFYARLGLDFEVHPASPGHAGCDLSNGIHLMMDTEEFRGAYTPGWKAPAGASRAFLAFQFSTPAEVDAKYGELTGAGYQGVMEPWDAFWGMRYAAVLDPSGNGVDLYANLPTGPQEGAGS